VIISGLILIQTGFVDSREPVGDFFQNVKPWAFSIGLAVAVIGIILLVPSINSELSIDQISYWFGLSFVICSSGGFYYLFQRKKRHKHSPLLIIINLFFSMILLFMGIFVFFKRSIDLPGGLTFIVLFLILAIFLIKNNSNIKNSH
jgi:drug/metabolite transporter (DMT)-like permease